jgi:hypothetical protein
MEKISQRGREAVRWCPGCLLPHTATRPHGGVGGYFPMGLQRAIHPPTTHPPTHPHACTASTLLIRLRVNISAWRPSLLPRTLAHKDARMSRLRHHGHGGDLVSIPSRFVTDTLRDKTLLEQTPSTAGQFCKSAARQPSLPHVTMHPAKSATWRALRHCTGSIFGVDVLPRVLYSVYL